LREALRPFVGKPVTKVDGSLTAKCRAALVAAAGALEPQIYFCSNNTYSLYVRARVCQNYGGGAVYAESSLYLGDVDQSGTTLTAVAPDQSLANSSARTNWTVEEVQDLRAQLDAAKKAANNIVSALGDFGEYDN
jgi:hypothetical protein